MSYTVKLATFPPWKSPALYATLAGSFATTAEAAEAGAAALARMTERELDDLTSEIQVRSASAGQQSVTAIKVPKGAVHGYLIYDDAGVEVFNWTTLDVALERATES